MLVYIHGKRGGGGGGGWCRLINDDFAEDGEEETRFAGGYGRREDVDVTAADVFVALDVNPRLEDGLVDPTHPTALGFRHQIDGLQSRLVRYVNAEFLHAGLVVAIRRRFICIAIRMRNDVHIGVVIRMASELAQLATLHRLEDVCNSP